MNLKNIDIMEPKEVAIAFHRWMLRNDTKEHAEKWFNFSDEDMFDYFEKTKLDNQ